MFETPGLLNCYLRGCNYHFHFLYFGSSTLIIIIIILIIIIINIIIIIVIIIIIIICKHNDNAYDNNKLYIMYFAQLPIFIGPLVNTGIGKYLIFS